MKNGFNSWAILLLLLLGTCNAMAAEDGVSVKVGLSSGWSRAEVEAGKERNEAGSAPKVGDTLEMEELRKDENGEAAWKPFYLTRGKIAVEKERESGVTVVYLRSTFRWKTLDRERFMLMLQLRGLETGCEVWVNGTLVGHTDWDNSNFDIAPCIRENDENTILIRLDLRRLEYSQNFDSATLWKHSRFVWSRWLSAGVLETSYREAVVRASLDYSFGASFDAESQVQAEFRIEDPTCREVARTVAPLARPEAEEGRIEVPLKIFDPIFSKYEYHPSKKEKYILSVILFSVKDGVRTVYDTCSDDFGIGVGEMGETCNKKLEMFHEVFQPSEIEAILRPTTDTKTFPSDRTCFPRPAELKIVTSKKENGCAFLDVSVPVVECDRMVGYCFLVLDPDGTPLTFWEDFTWGTYGEEFVQKTCLKIPVPETPDPRPYRFRAILYTRSYCEWFEDGSEALYGDTLYDGLETTFEL